MPRKAPSDVKEHRITLGDFERKQLTQAIDSYQADKILENTTNIVIAGAAVGAVAVGAYVAYQIYNVIPDLFKTDSDQQGGLNWLASWAGFGGQYDNYVKKEWATFGIPMNMEQIGVMYALNTRMISDRLELAKKAAKASAPDSGAGRIMSAAGFKTNAKAEKYINEGHAKDLEELEAWKLYYIDYYQNNPPRQEETGETKYDN
jgi:hypothetical protein